jgi:predicted regulator of Ras-like GTPase activity (Roadblock/LC7/MglB family)
LEKESEKSMPRKKLTREITTESPPIIENNVETTDTNRLRANLEKIKEHPGVVGYIFRNTSSAAIDLKDPSKIIDYAIISSSALDAAEELSTLFNLGAAKHITVQGKEVKMLATTIGENKLTIFMEKTVDPEKILKKLRI